MSLRRGLIIYLILVHLVLGGIAGWLLRERGPLLLALELGTVASLVTGLVLVQRLFGPLRVVRSGVDLLRESDFTSRFREVGHPELDPLIRVYNQMADHLREERIRSEEQEHFLQRIVTASPAGILTLDLDDRVAMANPAAGRLLEAEPEALRGCRLDELESPLARGLAELEAGATELLRLQGRRRVRCQTLTFMDRGFARRFMLLDELTDELYRTEKAAYEKLIRMVSHEVGNTAGAVGSLLESCLSYREQLAEADRDDFATAISVALTRTGHLHRFVQGFADVVRLPAPSLQPVDLHDLVEHIGRLLEADCQARRISVEIINAAKAPTVTADPVQLEQALLNVVKNAADAVRSDGRITVRVDSEAGPVRLRVIDDGGGVSDEVLKQVFTPFYSTKADGQGIGLTLVQEILVGHGCDFSLENGPAGTAVFTIVFPATA